MDHESERTQRPSGPTRVNPAHPRPDRSKHVPNFVKTAENDCLDIGWGQGILSDGRPFRIECWCQDQTTYVQAFFSSTGLEDLDRNELQRYLEREGLVRFVSAERYASGRLMSDDGGHSIWEINVVVADEVERYAEIDVPLQAYTVGH